MPINTLFASDELQWINVSDPQEEDVLHLKNQLQLPSHWVDMCLDVNHLPTFDSQNNWQFYLLRENTAERLNLNNISAVSTKIGLFVSEKCIVTIHRSRQVSLHTIVIEQGDRSRIVQAICLGILSSFKTEAQRIQEVLDDVETELFMKESFNQLNVKRLYKLKRKCSLNLRLLHLSKDSLEALVQAQWPEALAKKPLNIYQSATVDFDYLFAQVNNAINLCLALNEHKNNEVMKVIGKYSAYFMPISFLAGLYGMNFAHMPELQNPYAYYICLGVMLVVVLLTFFYMNRRQL